MRLVKQPFQLVQLLQREVGAASSLLNFGRVVLSLGFIFPCLVFAVRVDGLVDGAIVVVVAAAVAVGGGDGADGGGGRGGGSGGGGGGGDCVFGVGGREAGADAVVLWSCLGLVSEAG